MKAIRIIPFMMAFLLSASFTVSAQKTCPQFSEGKFGDFVVLSAKEMAEWRINEMDKTVNLDEKQYKKIYKIFLKEEKAREAVFADREIIGPPHIDRITGSQGMGDGAPMVPPGNHRIQWIARMMEGGIVSREMPFEGDFGELPKPTVGGKEIDSDEYRDAREAKIRKILASEQYMSWNNLCSDPSKIFVW